MSRPTRPPGPPYPDEPYPDEPYPDDRQPPPPPRRAASVYPSIGTAAAAVLAPTAPSAAHDRPRHAAAATASA